MRRRGQRALVRLGATDARTLAYADLARTASTRLHGRTRGPAVYRDAARAHDAQTATAALAASAATEKRRRLAHIRSLLRSGALRLGEPVDGVPAFIACWHACLKS